MMRRESVEHVLRAAGAVSGASEFVLIGSASLFCWVGSVPEEMALTREVDVYAPGVRDPALVTDMLEGSLGRDSQFDKTFGYYCDGVGPETATLPIDWQERVRRYSNANTNGIVAIVPEPNDIALSKLCAWREKDRDWLRVGVKHALLDVEVMRSRLARMPERAGPAATLASRLDALAASLT